MSGLRASNSVQRRVAIGDFGDDLERRPDLGQRVAQARAHQGFVFGDQGSGPRHLQRIAQHTVSGHGGGQVEPGDKSARLVFGQAELGAIAAEQLQPLP